MKIAEMFCSVQGEGMLAGMPSVFIRASGCNLRCVWCDTPYASWAPEGRDYEIGEIVEYVSAQAPRHVVVTGGEPMIAPGIVELTQELHELDRHITIETAGTVHEPVECDLMSISPKLANSTPRGRDGGRWAAQHDRLRIQPVVLRRLMHVYSYQLKFVVSSEADLEEIRALARELDAPADRVMLMPEGADANTLRGKSRWLTDIAMREGYRYCPRLHIELFGNVRGT